MTILEEIAAERQRQDEKWGGANNDDDHSSHDWTSYIVKHLGMSGIGDDWNPSLFRKQMVRIAALAVAAIEWHDRNFKR